MNWIKVIFFNIMLICTFAFLLLITPPLYNTLRAMTVNDVDRVDAKANFPVYDNAPWAAQYFRDIQALHMPYEDGVVWETNDMATLTVNVENGRRVTHQGDAPTGRPVWFFGGSTTFGIGTDDANTYPSLFAQATGRPVTNFGVPGYVARQSLAVLQNQYIQQNGGGKTIVFYDGLNDVIRACANEADVFSTVREAQIRTEMEKTNDPFAWRRLFEQWGDFLRRIRVSRQGVDAWKLDDVCTTSDEFVQAAATDIVRVWSQAQILAEANGDRFLAVLQPVAHIGDPITDYIPKDRIWEHREANFLAFYPHIRRAAAAANIPIVDLTDVYSGCGICYIDQGHVGPDAHAMLVARLAEVVP